MIKKMWYIHPMGYYSVLKKNEILSTSGKWMELELLMLSEISQTEKDEHFPCHMWDLHQREE
jgi:hypothetical protein